MKRVMEGNYLLITISLLVLTYSCCTSNITGRFQVTFLPEGELQSMASQEYRQFLGQHKLLPHGEDPRAELVKRVGEKLSNAVNRYYAGHQVPLHQRHHYDWEYSVVESSEVNAWCLPGGKIIVYSGLLSVASNEAALAVVMGHEIAHALARHGNERLSHALLASGIEIVGRVITAGDIQTRTIFECVYPQASRLKVLLPYIREQELEADRLGLIFTALAGFDPNEAIPLWTRMHKAMAGSALPEFLSTHPSEDNRIRNLKCFMPEALRHYRMMSR